MKQTVKTVTVCIFYGSKYNFKEKIMQKNKKDKQKELIEKMKTKPSRNDPDGSYTGVPLTPGEKPAQDADDL